MVEEDEPPLPDNTENLQKFLNDYENLKKKLKKFWAQNILKKKFSELEKEFNEMELRLSEIKPSNKNIESLIKVIKE